MLNIRKVPLKQIKPAAYNPRVNLAPGDPEYSKLAKSLSEFGSVEPLVWNQRSGNLVGGHQRLKVLAAQGATEVTCSVVDLSPAREKALNLAIDEIALKKGHNYMTVVLNYLTGRVVWMGEGRSAETLDQFFAGMTEPQKAALEAVAIDMWEPYINRVQHHCPQANIVFDFFHVVQGFGRVIDKIRRDEYLQASQKNREIIRGSRYLLLKNPENLTPKQRPRLRKLLAVNRRLNTVYVLKDQLKMVYYHSDRQLAQQTLDDWCRMAQTIRHPAMQAFIRKLRFFEYGILNHADYPIGTSDLEGMNNKIKLIKRRAYGYHDSEYFALKVKQAFPGKNSTNFFR